MLISGKTWLTLTWLACQCSYQAICAAVFQGSNATFPTFFHHTGTGTLLRLFKSIVLTYTVPIVALSVIWLFTVIGATLWKQVEMIWCNCLEIRQSLLLRLWVLSKAKKWIIVMLISGKTWLTLTWLACQCSYQAICAAAFQGWNATWPTWFCHTSSATVVRLHKSILTYTFFIDAFFLICRITVGGATLWKQVEVIECNCLEMM